MLIGGYNYIWIKLAVSAGFQSLNKAVSAGHSFMFNGKTYSPAAADWRWKAELVCSHTLKAWHSNVGCQHYVGDLVLHTHSHSCVCQLPAHIQGHKHICSCPVCSCSAAHNDRCQVWSTRPSLAHEKSTELVPNQNYYKNLTVCYWKDFLTFEKVGCKPSFVNWSIRHKLQPKVVGAAFDVIWFVVATETGEQRAALRTAVPHLHVVVSAAVVSLNLQSKWRTAKFARGITADDTEVCDVYFAVTSNANTGAFLSTVEVLH